MELEALPRQPDYGPVLLGVYLLGTCMGAILYQRGVMLLRCTS